MAATHDFISPQGNVADGIVEGHGDDATVSPNHSETAFRVFFQNVCGMKVQAHTHNLGEIVGIIDTFRTSVMCLAETNVNWRHTNA